MTCHTERLHQQHKKIWTEILTSTLPGAIEKKLSCTLPANHKHCYDDRKNYDDKGIKTT